MKRKASALFVLLIGLKVFATPVDQNTAKLAGLNFLKGHFKSTILKSTGQLTLAYQETSNLYNFSADQSPVVYFYIFNTIAVQGFVIVSADDNVSPILAYSNESNFTSNDIPVNVAEWLKGYKIQISSIIEKKITATVEINKSWESLLAGNTISSRGSRSKNPLLKTTWNQYPYYNDLCPYEPAAQERTVTGCVATAMAQVMKYHNWPKTGNGFHSYSSNHYGTLSANFGSTKYNWDSMPNNLSKANIPIATLMYHCGVSANMNYGTLNAGGSGAYVISNSSNNTNCAEYALKTYFGYSPKLKGIKRDGYTDAQWLSLIENELNNDRPVIYVGYGTTGGHCFVADGFDADDKMHFNWGWGGYVNGYFSVNAITPDGKEFNKSQQALIGITPVSDSDKNQTDSLVLYDNVSIPYPNVSYMSKFVITTQIQNKSQKDFVGNFCAASFDFDGNLTTIFDSVKNVNVSGGKTIKISFTGDSVLSMLPGVYDIRVFYKYPGGEWVQISDFGNYVNSLHITIENQSWLSLYSAMKISGSSSLIQGQPATMNLNILNSGTKTYKFNLNLSLFKMDGTLAFTIDSNINLSLNATQHFPSDLTFSTASVDADPGSYYLALLYNTPGKQKYLIGSTNNYQNPIKINVQAPPLLPDKYEDNNTIVQAYTLPVNFKNDKASITTLGSNCHIGSDHDYYKLDLPKGYSYQVNARIKDANSISGTHTYTLDAIASSSLDSGKTWSDVYDDSLAIISLKTNKPIYFLIAPHFLGYSGTYELDLSITRTENSGIKNNTNSNEILVYPNPANNFLEIDLSTNNNTISSLSLSSIQGQPLILKSKTSAEQIHHLSLENIPSGIYLLQLQTINGVVSRKIIVKK